MQKKIKNLLKELFPLNRSLSGPHNLKTLKILKKDLPLKIKKIKTGTKVFDWKIPKVWHFKSAQLIDLKTNSILIDSKNSNLHVMTNSRKINKIFKWTDLKNHLFYSNKSSAIPYRTTYYDDNWGLCVTKEQYLNIKNSKGPFKIIIDSSFKDGFMHYGELLLKGKSKKEILVSTYICHPSLANDNLSGIIVTHILAQYLLNKINRYYSYRIVFHPETIGAVAYAKINENKLKDIDFGTVITCTGGKENFSYKKSFDNDHFINNLINKLFKTKKIPHKVHKFDVVGSDERQYSSQAFKINIVSIFKGKYYEYPNYHLSTDNLSYVKSENILKSINLHKDFINLIENTPIYKINKTECEIMLSKYNLYSKIGGGFNYNKNKIVDQHLILWLLFLLNGKNTLEMIADKLNVKISRIKSFCNILKNKKLIYRV
ncbi:DUF4910 domain-containing protein [Alphaproteobacteria bacterium]|nr:DUF4910 domain-containing protein [Alphaproteobacteria bacterium]